MLSNIPKAVGAGDITELRVGTIQLAKNLLLLQSWFPKEYFSFNGVGWFLSTLVFLQLLNLPMRTIILKVDEKKLGTIKVGLIAAGIFGVCLGYCYLTDCEDVLFRHYVFPPSRLFEYLGGMAVGYLAAKFCSVSNQKNGKKTSSIF